MAAAGKQPMIDSLIGFYTVEDRSPDTRNYTDAQLCPRVDLLEWLSQEPSKVPMNPVTAKMSTSNPPEPMLEQAIRHRAYELYLQRGMAHGHDVDDWLQAEAEVVHGHSTTDSN
jgi:hypothetical protein